MTVLEVAVAVLLVSGVLLAVTAALGLQQFPDVFARMHAATKPATLGLLLILLAAALVMPSAGDVAKLLLVVVLQFITAPVAAHMIGRAAYRSGTELSPATAIDELAESNRRLPPDDDRGRQGGVAPP
jgi:multicomponent Na+:H+ antiporter subunit G